jgi:hypothetical protein
MKSFVFWVDVREVDIALRAQRGAAARAYRLQP